MTRCAEGIRKEGKMSASLNVGRLKVLIAESTQKLGGSTAELLEGLQ